MTAPMHAGECAADLTPAQVEAIRPAYWRVSVTIDGPDGTVSGSVEVPHAVVEFSGHDNVDQAGFELLDQLVTSFREESRARDGEYTVYVR